MTDKNSYKSVLKTTSIFGGVQVINIIIQIVRSKLIAVLLGTDGMGVSGLYNSTISLIQSISGFGIGTSAVKNIAAANSNNDVRKVSKVLIILRKLVWITGFLGAIFTLMFSKWISQLTFGSEAYELGFKWLSISFLFNQISAGQRAALQGLRKIKMLASANLFGAFLGLILTAPLYYFYRIDGIVPAIVLTSIVSMIVSWFYARKIDVEKIDVDKELFVSESKEIISMGVMLSLSGFVAILSSYILRIFIGKFGSFSDVGLYTAGFNLVEGYVGIVFTAMSSDYYPRLSEVHDDLDKLKETVTQQAEIAIIILTPIIVGFLLFSTVVINILYSRQFLPVTLMVAIAILGMYFRASSWAMGFILFAKSDSNLFIKTAFFFNSIFLASNILGYYFYGLTGLGISFLFNYIIHFFVLKYITNKRYEFFFLKGFNKLFLVGFIICAISFLISMLTEPLLKYSFGFLIFIIAGIFTYRGLNDRIDLESILNKFKK